MYKHCDVGMMSELKTTTKIEDLTPNSTSTVITGVLIAKQQPRQVPSKQDDVERYACSFTIRDSLTSTINATCWGSLGFVNNINEKFHVGDVVDIQNAQVSPMTYNSDTANQFRPDVSSDMQLHISEKFSRVTNFEGDKANYEILFHFPSKSDDDFFSLYEIIYNGKNLEGNFINILAVVRQVMPVRNFATRGGRNASKCEVKVFDRTYQNFIFAIWNDDYINLAQNWIPYETVLFIADSRVTFDNFRQTMIASTTNKTIITPDPNSRHARQLLTYAQSIEPFKDETNDSTIDITTINAVYTVDKIRTLLKDVTMGTSYGIVKALISHFDIDNGQIPFRCNGCRQWLSSQKTCLNDKCQKSWVDELTFSDTEFNLNISISDHTGSLDYCRIPKDVFEKFSATLVENLWKMNNEEKVDLKWKFLFERQKIYFKVYSNNINKMSISLIAIENEDDNNVVHPFSIPEP